jgi:hypothetical protein
MELLEYIGSIGGITGVLAFLMFMVYRQDHKTNAATLTALIQSLAKEQAEIVKAYNDSCREHTAAMVKQTEVQTELITWLQRNNGHNLAR